MSYNATTVRNERYAQRGRDDQGRLVSLITPSHGTSTGYVSYGCRCEPCSQWQRRRYEGDLERRTHNAEILRALQRCPAQRETPAPVAKPKPPPVEPEPLVEPEPEPAPASVVVDEPAEPITFTVGEKAVDGRVPPVIGTIRERIKDQRTLTLITKAYFEPDWSAPADLTRSNGHSRERRTFQGMEIIVGEGEGHPVIWFREREVATGKPAIVEDSKLSLRKAKGGRGGSTAPTEQRDLLELLKASGCEVETTGSGHIRVSKNGKTVVLPSTASDWRSLRNTIAAARKQGLM